MKAHCLASAAREWDAKWAHLYNYLEPVCATHCRSVRCVGLSSGLYMLHGKLTETERTDPWQRRIRILADPSNERLRVFPSIYMHAFHLLSVTISLGIALYLIQHPLFKQEAFRQSKMLVSSLPHTTRVFVNSTWIENYRRPPTAPIFAYTLCSTIWRVNTLKRR
jgi:hypothetical protein